MPLSGVLACAFENSTVASMPSVLVTFVVTTVSSMSLITPKRAVSGETSTSPFAIAATLPDGE
jgi:hypothetical protein